MNHYNLSRDLLEVRVRDYKLNSASIPKKARILSKLFARALGNSAGKVLSVYDHIFAQIQDNQPVEEIKKFVRRNVQRKSKVNIKLPFLKPRQARICGLVAMNYSGFFDSEVELYSILTDDLRAGIAPIEDIIEQSRQAGIANSQKYGDLLQRKQQAIYDFGVLMGIIDDNEQFKKLKESMPKDITKYFDMVVSMHKGGRLRVSWPLPLKKFSTSIRDGLYHDTITYAVQEGVGNDYGFMRPEEKAYDLMIEQLKDTVKEISSKRNSLTKKWKIAATLPAALFFLSGINAYADTTSEELRNVLKSDIFEAGIIASTSAGASAYSTADDANDFITTFFPSWFSTFTTSL